MVNRFSSYTIERRYTRNIIATHIKGQSILNAFVHQAALFTLTYNFLCVHYTIELQIDWLTNLVRKGNVNIKTLVKLHITSKTPKKKSSIFNLFKSYQVCSVCYEASLSLNGICTPRVDIISIFNIVFGNCR